MFWQFKYNALVSLAFRTCVLMIIESFLDWACFYVVVLKKAEKVFVCTFLAPRFKSLQAMESKENKCKTTNAERCKRYQEEKLKGVQDKKCFKTKNIQDWFWSPTKLPVKCINERKGRGKEPQNCGKKSWSIITNNQRSIWVPQPFLVMLLLNQEASRKLKNPFQRAHAEKWKLLQD